MLLKKDESPLYKVILSMLGYVLMMLGVIILLPLALLVIYPEDRHVAHEFILPGVLTVFAGYFLTFCTRGHRVTKLERNEGSLLVLIIWLVSCFVGAWPFYLNGNYTFTEALFESTSGFTTTGMTVTDVENASHLILFYRSILHLFGGVGLILILSAVLSNTYGMQLFSAEGHRDRLTPSLANSARTILYIYFGLIVGGTVGYVLCGMAPFDAVNFSISAVSTGGFATKAESIGYYQSVPIDLITVVLMLAGGTNFMATLFLTKGRLKAFFDHTETRVTVVLMAVGIPVVTAMLMAEHIDAHILKALDDALFQVVAVLTTTGLTTINDVWLTANFSTMPLILLMLVGGNSGSTAGGIKSIRAAIAWKNIQWNFQNMTDSKHVHRARELTQFGKRQTVSQKEIMQNDAYLVLYLFCMLASAFGFTLCGYDFRDAMFESVSILSTVGISIGVLHPGMSNATMWIAMVGMLVARLEVFLIPMAIQGLVDNGRNFYEERRSEREYKNRVEKRRRNKQLAKIRARREAEAKAKAEAAAAKEAETNETD